MFFNFHKSCLDESIAVSRGCGIYCHAIFHMLLGVVQGSIVLWGFICSVARSIQSKFRREFSEMQVPHRNTILLIVSCIAREQVQCVPDQFRNVGNVGVIFAACPLMLVKL